MARNRAESPKMESVGWEASSHGATGCAPASRCRQRPRRCPGGLSCRLPDVGIEERTSEPCHDARQGVSTPGGLNRWGPARSFTPFSSAGA